MGFDGMMGRVHEYIKTYPGQEIPIREIARVCRMSHDQVSNAMYGLRRYPRSGVSMPRRGWFRYDATLVYKTEPMPASRTTETHDEPAPLPARAPCEPRQEVPPADTAPALCGALFEAVAQDKHGFSIVQAEDGTREYVLVRRTFLGTLLEQAKDRQQVEAFKRTLRTLVREV